MKKLLVLLPLILICFLLKGSDIKDIKKDNYIWERLVYNYGVGEFNNLNFDRVRILWARDGFLMILSIAKEWELYRECGNWTIARFISEIGTNVKKLKYGPFLEDYRKTGKLDDYGE